MLRHVLVLAVLLASAHALTEQECLDKGGHLYNNHCYIWNSADLSWHNARAACENNYGPEFDLASITSIAENVFTSTTVRGDPSPNGHPDYWIGGHDLNGESDFRWADGTTWAWTNWGSGEPNGNTNENCVHSNWDTTGDGQSELAAHWNDASCTAYATESVCEAAIDYEITPAKCTELGGHVYGGTSRCFIYNPTRLNWHAAHDACKALHPGVELASVRSRAENDFMSTTPRGLTDPNNGPWYYIGLHDRNNENGFEYTDGSDPNAMYSGFPSSEPNNLSGEDCTHVLFFQGRSDGLNWNDIGCESTGPSMCAINVGEEAIETGPTFEAPCKGCVDQTMTAHNPNGNRVTLQFNSDAEGPPCVTTEL